MDEVARGQPGLHVERAIAALDDYALVLAGGGTTPMTAFFVLYAITITIELILSLVMAIFLFLIMSPTGRTLDGPQELPPADRPLARTADRALHDAFATTTRPGCGPPGAP